MKKHLLGWVAGLVMAGSVLAEGGISGEELTEVALREVLKDASAALTTAKIADGAAIAVLPFAGDDGQVLSLVKNAVTASGKVCVEGKEDPVLAELVKEIEWDERKEDILDAQTVDRFGKLKSAQYLLYGSVRQLACESRYVLMELELHLTEIATKQHIWGGTFAKRIYAPTPDPDGRVDIPAEVRDVMRGQFRERMAASLKNSTKLAAVKRVACLPLAGDTDQYAAGLARDVLSASAVTPVNLDVQTRAEARFALRQGVAAGDAILYGAVRDISAVYEGADAARQKTYRAQMEVQLWIEKGDTREVLWSDTIYASQNFTLGPKNWWGKLCAYAPVLESMPWLIVAVPLGLLLVLVVLVIMLRSMTRVR